MKTENVKITSHGVGMDEALKVTEKLAEDYELGKKESLRLRLLTEELIGLMRGITGDVEAIYWVEKSEDEFALHLKGDVFMDLETRSQLLAASTSGKNDAARGFMGKLREMATVLTLPSHQGPSALTGFSMGLMSMGSPVGYNAGMSSYVWSMNSYKDGVKYRLGEDGEAEAAWDELEKSIVANLADEVSVRIVGTEVEFIITKTF